MGSPAKSVHLSARCLIASLALASSPLGAATLHWDGAATQTANTDGGTGTWDTVLTNWDNGSNGADIAWNNSAPDAAVFGGTAGTVTLGTGITAASLTFNTTGYIITGNTLTISAGGSISVGAGLTATVNSSISSTGALNKIGTGTLRINGGTGSITGALSVGSVGVAGGTFQVSGGTFSSAASQSFMGTATLTVDGGTLSLAGLRTGEGSGASSTINLSAGTLNITGSTNAQSDGRFNSFLLSHWGSSTALNISGTGTLNSRSARLYQTWDGTSTITQSGGTVNLVGVDVSGRSSNASYALNGGRLNLGAFGYLASTNKTFTVGSATIGAYADSTSTTNVTLSAGTTATIDTLDSDGAGTGRTMTWSGVFSGSGNLAKAGLGTLNLSGANTFSGTLSASGGTVNVTNTLRNAAGVTANDGGTIVLNATNLIVGGHGTPVGSGYLLTASGSGVVKFTSSDMRIGNVTLSNGGSLTSDRATGSWGVLLGNTSAGAANVTVSGSYATAALMNGTGGLNMQGEQNFVVGDITGNANNDLIVSMTLADPNSSLGAAGGVVKSGAGTMAITTAASYTGATRVNGGTLLLNTANYGRALQTSGIFVTGASSTLAVNGTNILYSGSSYIPITVDAGTVSIVTSGASNHNHFGTLTLSNGATISGATTAAPFASQYSTFDASLTVLSGGSARSVISGANASYGFVFNQTGGSVIDVGTTSDALADLEVSATVLSDASSTQVIKRGAGRLLFSANNSRSTTTLIGAGTVIAGHSNALGTGAVTLNEGTTGTSATSLLLNAASASVNLSRAVTVANLGSGTVTLGSASTGSASNFATFSGLVTLDRSATLSSSASDDRLAFTGGIAGAGGVSIAGGGRVIFATTAPTYAGATSIASGATLQLGDGGLTAIDLLPNGSAVSLVSGATLQLAKGGNSEVIGTLSGAGGTVRTLAANGTLAIGGDNGTGTFAGSLTNHPTDGSVLSLIKSGTGNQTLTGSSTFTGTTAISNGTLTLGNGGSLAAGSAVSVASGATLSVLAGGAVNGATTVTGTLTGSGTLGGVTLADGAVLAAGTSGSGTLTLGSLTLGQGAADGSTISFGIAGLAGSGSIASALQVNGAVTVNSGAGKVTLAFGSALANLAGGTVESPLTYDVITYTGAQLATLSAFTYTGTTGARQGVSIGAGTKTIRLVVSAAYPIWKGSTSDWSDATAWRLNSNSADTDFRANDTVLFDDSASSGTVNLTANVAPLTVTFDGATREYTVGSSGGFAITAGSLFKSGASKLVINNANSFAGGTTLAGGTLELGNGSALGSGSVNLESGTLDLNGQSVANPIVLRGGSIVSDGATLSGAITESGGARGLTVGSDLTLAGDSSFTGGITVTAGTLTVSGSGRLGAGATAGVGSYAGAIANAGTLAFSTSAAQTLSGAISGAGSLSKSGASTLALTGDNTFTGGITVTAGTLAVSGAGRLGAGATPAVGSYAGNIANDGTLDFSTSAAQTLSGAISGSGALSKSGSATLALTGDNSFTGGITVTAGTLEVGGSGRLGQGSYAGAIANAGILSFTGTGNQTLTGALSGAGTVTRSGTGTLTVTGANAAFTGGVTLSGGVLAVGSNTPFGTTGTLALNGGTLRSDGASARSLANPVTVGGAFTLGDASANGAVTLSGTVDLGGASRTITAASAATLSGVISNGTLVKAGSGTLTVSGATTFAGGLTVSAGTLALTGTNSHGVLSVNVQSNATLDLRGGGLYRSGGFTGTGTHMVISGGTLIADKFDYGNANNLGTVRNNYFTVELNNGGKIRLSADQSFFRAFQVGTGGGVLEVDAGVTATKSAGTTGGQNIFYFTQDSTLTFGGAGNLVMNDGLGAYGNTGFSLAKTGAGTLTLAAANTFSGGFTLSQGIVRVGNNGALGSGTVTLNGGEISSDGASARSVANAVVLGGDVTFGDTAATGALTLGSTLGLGGQARTLTVDAALTVTGAVSNGSLTKAGSATLALNGASDYSGNTTVSAGTLALGAGAGLYRGAYRPSVLSVASGATLELQNWHYNESTASLGGLAAAASSMVVDGATIRVVGTGATSYGRGVTVNAGGVTLEAGAGASWTIDVTNDNTAWVYNGNPSVTLSGSGTGAFQKVLGLGSGGLTKSGTGTWTVSGANTFAGATTVSNGTLRLGNASALGTTAAGTSVASGATLDLNGQTVGAEAVGIAGTGVGDNGTLVNNAGSAASLAGAVSMSLDASVGGSGNLTLSGQVGGAFRLTKVGAGTLVLAAANNYGATTIAAGTLQVGNGGTTGSLGSGAVTNNAALEFNRSNAHSVANAITGTGSLTQSGAGVLTLTAVNTYSGATTIGSGSTLEVGGAGTLASSPVAVGGTFLVNSTANFTLGGALTGSGLLGKSNTGTLTISTANAGFLGSVTVDAGTLSVGHANALGGRTITVNSGGTLEIGSGVALVGTVTVNGTGLVTGLGSFSGTMNLARDLELSSANASFAGTVSVAAGNVLTISDNTALGSTSSGAASVAAGAVLDLNGSALSAAGLTLNGAGISGGGALRNNAATAAVHNGVLTLGSAATIGAGDITLGGSIAGANALTKTGAGTLTLNVSSNAATSLTISGGTVIAGNADALGQGAVTVSGGALNLNAQSVSRAITLSGGSLSGASAYSGTVTLDGSASVSGAVAGTFNLGLPSTNNTLTAGAGTQFTGTLAGQGTIAGDVTVSGAHTPGNSPGKQTINGDLTYTAGATVQWELITETNLNGQAGIAYDQIVVNGDLNFSGATSLTLLFNGDGSDVNWTDAFWNTARSWLVYDVGGATLSFSSLSLTDAVAYPLDGVKTVSNVQDSTTATLASVRADAGFYLGQVGSDVRLFYRPVPEPSTYGLVLGALALAGAAIRRRKKTAK